MYSANVISVLLVSCFVSTVLCDPPKNLDEKCLVPPPNDVDPMSCCKIPELLESSLIDTCASKVFGPEATTQASESQTHEPPFAPHIRVSTKTVITLFSHSKIVFPVSNR